MKSLSSFYRYYKNAVMNAKDFLKRKKVAGAQLCKASKSKMSPGTALCSMP